MILAEELVTTVYDAPDGAETTTNEYLRPAAGAGSVDTNSVVELRKNVFPDSAAVITFVAVTFSLAIGHVTPDVLAKEPAVNPPVIETLSPACISRRFSNLRATAIYKY